jgi:hypothetical protein
VVPHQTVGKVTGLAVFARDALSSVACVTEEILFVLAVARTAAFGHMHCVAVTDVLYQIEERAAAT